MKDSVVPGRNGGSLLKGGVPGNKGGGRLRNVVREKCAQMVQSDVVPYLRKCLKSESWPERKWACETLLRYGIGQRLDLDESEPKERPGFDMDAFKALAAGLGYTQTGEPIEVPGFDD